MIVAASNGHLRFITQNDHACFAAELLSLWRSDGLPEHPRRRELLFAAREHDNGWREADSAPFCDRESGRPHDFLSLPRRERQEIWRRGPTRHAEREPYASLLIVRHAFELHRSHQGEPEWADEFAFWHELRDTLTAATGREAEEVATEVEADYPFVELSDLFSLAVCQGWEEAFELHGWVGRTDRGVLELDPFPLAGATTFRIPCRRLPERRFSGDADLAVELASARWQELTVRVVPG